MAKPALPWLTKLCALYEKHDSSVYSCSAEAHVSGVLISVELDRGTMYLLAHPKGLSSSYAETASMSISIHDPPGGGKAPGNGELIARQFINILRRADKGNISITGSTAKPSALEPRIPRVSQDDAAAARAAAAEEIRWAAFIGYKGLVTKGAALDPNPDDPTEAQHQYLVSNFQDGYSRSDFISRFSVDPADVVRDAFDKLLAMGIVSMNGDQVHTHTTGPDEELTFRTFLYSKKHHAKARELWADEFDTKVDYTVELRKLTALTG